MERQRINEQRLQIPVSLKRNVLLKPEHEESPDAAELEVEEGYGGDYEDVDESWTGHGESSLPQ